MLLFFCYLEYLVFFVYSDSLNVLSFFLFLSFNFNLFSKIVFYCNFLVIFFENNRIIIYFSYIFYFVFFIYIKF